MILHDKNTRYLIFDAETEGLNLRYSRPWQLSWMVCDNKNILERHNRYIDIPDLNIPENVKVMTHFNEADYNRLKEPPEQIYHDFKQSLLNPKYIPLGQNILGFDIFMIGQLQKMCGEKIDFSYLPRCIDTRALGRAWKDKVKKPDKRSDYIYWQYKLIHDRTNARQRVSLNTLAKELGVDYDPNKHHDADYDIELTYKVYLKLAKILEL